MPDIVIPAPWWVQALVAGVGLVLIFWAWRRGIAFAAILTWELLRNMVRERQLRRRQRLQAELRARAHDHETAELHAAHIARIEARRRAGWGTD